MPWKLVVSAISWGSGLGREMQREDFGRSACLTLPICHQHPLLCGREKRGVWLQRCLLCLACHCWWQIWCTRVAINGGAAFLLAPACFVSFHHPALSLKWPKHWILEAAKAEVADAFANSVRENVLWCRPGWASRFSVLSLFSRSERCFVFISPWFGTEQQNSRVCGPEDLPYCASGGENL